MRIILILIILSVFVWLFILDFVPGQSLEIYYNFCRPQPMITELSPGSRLEPIEKEQDGCWRKIVASPVYFDTRVPQYFERAQVKIKYKNPANEKFQLGPQIKKGEWLWLLRDVSPQRQDGEWLLGKAEFDLRGIYQNSTIMRWLISAPEIEKDKNTIWLDEVKITFYKDSLKFNNLTGQVKSYLRKIIRK